MRIPIDRQSSRPIYRQIQDFLKDQILTNALPPDASLPASRDLARQLGVSRLTVVNAYKELEAQGLVVCIQGGGTFVARAPLLPPREDELANEPVLPRWQRDLQTTQPEYSAEAFGRLLDSAAQPGSISFAGGSGDRSLFPLEDFTAALRLVLRDSGRDALGYGETAGYPPLRSTIAQILSGQGIPTHPGQVLITSGSQQGISLVTRLLLQPGDTVVAEAPTHMGFLDLCRSIGVRVVGIPVDEQGMQVDRIEPALGGARPALIYTVPNFQNPTGACLSAARRRKLIALAERLETPILEDDYVGELRFCGSAQPAVKTLDRTGAVIYVSTFSKMLIPSLRVGFIVVSQPAFDRLLDVKHASDVATSNLIQRALDAYITVGRYQACLRRARQVFNRRRETMLRALSANMPVGVQWTTPQGGFYVWLTLPGGLSADDLFPVAARHGVTFAPGSFFYPTREPRPHVRLNYAMQPEPAIVEGIRRLGSAIREAFPARPAAARISERINAPAD